MSDINLIIEEAADILTRNERKLKKRKDNYTPKELEEMLAEQEIQKSQNRASLNEKLVGICENAAREYNLSSVPLGMMEKIALDISAEVKEGNITSVNNVEKNKTIIKTVQKEATKAQIIENYEAEIGCKETPHGEILQYIEEIKYIPSNPEVAKAIKKVFDLGEAERKINDIADGITIENADEKADEIQKIINSELYKEEQKEKSKANLKIFENAETKEEKKIACDYIEAIEVQKRCQVNPKNQQVFVNLLQNCLEQLHSNLGNPKNIANYIRTNLLSNKHFLSSEQRVELEGFIKQYELGQNQDMIIDFLAERVTAINKAVTKEDVISMAKKAANMEISEDRADEGYLKNQGLIRLVGDEKFVNYCDLVNQIFELNENSNSINWQELSELNGQSTELYALTLRAMNKKSRELSDNTIYRKTQDLINEFATNEKSITKEDAYYVEESDNENTSMETSYWVLAENIMSAPENFESIKQARIEHIKSSKRLSKEEKKIEILKLEEAETPEELLEYALDGIEKDHIQKGKKFDREKSKKDIIDRANSKTAKDRVRSERNAQRDTYAARAKVLLEQGEYERYLKATRSLGKGNEIYDEELLDLLQEVDSELYEHLCGEYFAKCKSNQEIQKRSTIRIREIKRNQREQMKKKAKTQEETERPAEERTEIIESDTQNENALLENIISNVTNTNDFMNTAKREEIEDEER